MACSGQRTDPNIVVLAPGWGAFIGASNVVATYYLGHALWLNEQGRSADDTGKAPSR
ncbi:hypothetical protein ACFQ7J_30530 [Streptomyces sp. NPDC056501]|uniref:hypothetical protein n=1 Tax=Streptomyces sp. NPDC056501 TaxID=3345841 RepID=UPI0036B12823